MKVIGYVRVSTEEQATQGVSLAAQAEKVRAYANLYDLELVEIIEEAGQSAKTLNRPGLQQALGMLASGLAVGLVVTKLDRLTRSVVDLGYLINHFFGDKAKHQASLLSVTDQVDTRTAGGRLVLNVLMSVAQWEREAIGERTSTALRYKISQGEYIGTTPFGFRRCGTRLEPVGEEQAVLSAIVAARSNGSTLMAIAAMLNNRGIPTKRGKRWAANTVKQILDRARLPA